MVHFGTSGSRVKASELWPVTKPTCSEGRCATNRNVSQPLDLSRVSNICDTIVEPRALVSHQILQLMGKYELWLAADNCYSFLASLRSTELDHSESKYSQTMISLLDMKGCGYGPESENISCNLAGQC
jgi:hypothetical protein